ncbi:MAG: hypothetical protein WBE34_20870, partial [Candidatus Nitrosopolaris sp.]
MTKNHSVHHGVFGLNWCKHLWADQPIGMFAPTETSLALPLCCSEDRLFNIRYFLYNTNANYSDDILQPTSVF